MKLTPGVAVPLFAAGLVAGGPLAPRQLTSYVVAAAPQRTDVHVSAVVAGDDDDADGPVPVATSIVYGADNFVEADAVYTSTVKAAAAALRRTGTYVSVGDDAGAGAEAGHGFVPAPTSIINEQDNFIKARAVQTGTADGAAAAPRQNDAHDFAKANVVHTSAIDAENEIMARAVYSSVNAAAAAAAAAPASSVPTAVSEHAEYIRPRSVGDNIGDFRIDRSSCTKSQRREISKALGDCAYLSHFAAWFTSRKGKGDELIAGSFGASDFPTRRLLLNDFLTMHEYCQERDSELWILRGRDVDENRRTVSCLTQAECEVQGGGDVVSDDLPFVVRRSESGDVGICPGSFGRREGACGRLGLANVFLQHASEIVSAAYESDADSASHPWNAEAFMTVATGYNLSCIAYLPATQTARLRA